jgi:2-hydroxy-6-oxonona-2,4-dienedioate hydrolase
MSRRSFFTTVGLAVAGASLARCSFVTREPVPEPDPPVADIEKLMAQGMGALRHIRTDVNGLQMHSLVSSNNLSPDAPVVVLVHGSGLSGRYMIPTAQQLTADCRVYVPDLPGFGDSDKPEKILNVPELADWLAAWMHAVELDRAALLGNSFGCQVIADLAARYPERVERAILQGPTTPPEERSWFWQFIRWRQNQRYNPRSLGPVTYEDYKKCGLRRMYGSFRSQLTDRIEDKAPRIQAPVLVVRGEHDPIANQSWCEEIARLCPQGRLAIIPGVAHTLCYTAPVQLAAVSRSFVNEIRQDANISAYACSHCTG